MRARLRRTGADIVAGPSHKNTSSTVVCVRNPRNRTPRATAKREAASDRTKASGSGPQGKGMGAAGGGKGVRSVDGKRPIPQAEMLKL